MLKDNNPWKYFVFEKEDDHNYSFRASAFTLEDAEEHINEQAGAGCLDLDKVILMKTLPLEDYKRVPKHIREQ